MNEVSQSTVAAQHLPANPDSLEVAPGTSHERLEGWSPQLANENDVRLALEKAFDYRGDIAITRKDGSKVEGYIFDRRTGNDLSESFVRVIPSNAREKLSIPYSDIAALKFSDRDPAAGKSFEAWVKKYWEKRAAGEKNIQITPEALE
ncbi:MAG: hypothetical protein DMG64_03485 [Acidobacteria bacterium]|nr:MAG: hypothetical protein DMG64_03485 [Acidobacteriota bacterium]